MGHFESSNWGENGGEEEASDIGLRKAALICNMPPDAHRDAQDQRAAV
jgi:hypothetical protein